MYGGGGDDDVCRCIYTYMASQAADLVGALADGLILVEDETRSMHGSWYMPCRPTTTTTTTRKRGERKEEIGAEEKRTSAILVQPPNQIKSTSQRER
jgi:hypothetical protein